MDNNIPVSSIPDRQSKVCLTFSTNDSVSVSSQITTLIKVTDPSGTSNEITEVLDLEIGGK